MGLDINECAREPIDRPGAIQPHGILLVIEPSDETVRAAAGDLQSLLGREGAALGQTLEALIGQSLADLTRASGLRPGQEPLFLGCFRLGPAARELDIIAHERGGLVIVELEPSIDHRPSAARLLARLRAATARIQGAATIAEACRVAAAEVRAFTGHDRALVYEFLPDGSGRVVGEDGSGALPSLMHQHFPASDIPAQARALYRHNPIRVIPDIAYLPAPVLPAEFAAAFDMSDCALRSVSPVHIRYLGNMGVGASMSVSILQGTELWGLIACHSAGTTLVPYEVREACKQIAVALVGQIGALAVRAAAADADRLAKAREDVLARLAASHAVESELRLRAAEIKRLIPCDGLIIQYNGIVTTEGEVPDEAACRALADWSLRKDATTPYSTASLPDCYPAAREWGEVASGLLAIAASQEDPIEILWLRAEYAETVLWAGHPHQETDAAGRPAPLTPRASFAVWRETVRGRSLPWTATEIEAAQRLREGIERIKERQQVMSLQASVIHMSRVNAMGAMASSIAHELNQPLTAVASYTRSASKMLAAGARRGEIADIMERAGEQTLRAGEIIRHLRQLVAPVEGAIGPCSVESIIDGACSLGLIDAPRLGVTVDAQFDRSLEVFADKVQIQQVLLNLIRNALEAMAETDDRRLVIGAVATADGCVRISVCDSGPGVPARTREHLFAAFNSNKEGGLGIGLSICRTIVEAHGGKIWLEDGAERAGDTRGACFAFLLQQAPQHPAGAAP